MVVVVVMVAAAAAAAVLLLPLQRSLAGSRPLASQPATTTVVDRSLWQNSLKRLSGKPGPEHACYRNSSRSHHISSFATMISLILYSLFFIPSPVFPFSSARLLMFLPTPRRAAPRRVFPHNFSSVSFLFSSSTGNHPTEPPSNRQQR